MNGREKTKTFGLRTPTDLHYKLLFDIERLRKARSTVEAKYAAFDCAVDAWPLVDCVLHAVSDQRHTGLSGKPRGHKHAPVGFADLQSNRLPDLEHCRPIGNSVKHRVLKNDKWTNFSTNSTALLSHDEAGIYTARLFTYFDPDNEV